MSNTCSRSHLQALVWVQVQSGETRSWPSLLGHKDCKTARRVGRFQNRPYCPPRCVPGRGTASLATGVNGGMNKGTRRGLALSCCRVFRTGFSNVQGHLKYPGSGSKTEKLDIPSPPHTCRELETGSYTPIQSEAEPPRTRVPRLGGDRANTPARWSLPTFARAVHIAKTEFFLSPRGPVVRHLTSN